MILVVIAAVERINSSDVVECDTSPPTTNTTQIETQLYEWCLDDTACSDLYYQGSSTNRNFTLFRYMIVDIISDYSSLQQPLDEIVCGNRTDDEILEDLWMLILTSKLGQDMVCDLNYKLVINSEDLTSKCVCKEGEDCSSHRDPAILLKTIMSLSLILLFIICALQFFYIRFELSKIEHITRDNKKRGKILKALKKSVS